MSVFEHIEKIAGTFVLVFVVSGQPAAVLAGKWVIDGNPTGSRFCASEVLVVSQNKTSVTVSCPLTTHWEKAVYNLGKGTRWDGAKLVVSSPVRRTYYLEGIRLVEESFGPDGKVTRSYYLKS